MVRLITLMSFGLFLIACRKKEPPSPPPTPAATPCPYKNQICDTSLYTLMNKTQDTIFYGIGTNMWEDTLLPGRQTTRKYGKVKVTYTQSCERVRESWATHQLSSNWGEWAFNIDHCDSKGSFDYADTTKSRIVLYDDTEY
jgi:hypothetical protein